MAKEQEVQITSAWVGITDRCNFSCLHCGLGDYPQKTDMTVEGMEAVMDRISSPSLRSVTLAGKEPRLNPNILKIAEVAKRFGAHVEVFTNGFGMVSMEVIGKIVKELAEHGVDTVTVSRDQPHRDFARKNRIEIDYEALGTLNNVLLRDEAKVKAGIPPHVTVSTGSCEPFILPIGRARGLVWDKRVELARMKEEFIGPAAEAAEIREQMEQEFERWSEIDLTTHSCYCGPARLRRSLMRAWQARSLATVDIVIQPDIMVNPCIFWIMPPIGNLRDQSVKEIYQNPGGKLYEMLDKHGPQGLARDIGVMSEKEIREIFIEKTPCGLCERLVRENLVEIKRMID